MLRLGKIPPLNSSQPGGGRVSPADKPHEALESDLHPSLLCCLPSPAQCLSSRSLASLCAWGQDVRERRQPVKPHCGRYPFVSRKRNVFFVDCLTACVSRYDWVAKTEFSDNLCSFRFYCLLLKWAQLLDSCRNWLPSLEHSSVYLDRLNSFPPLIGMELPQQVAMVTVRWQTERSKG